MTQTTTRRGRPLTRGGVIDSAALHVIDASCACVALAMSDAEVTAERTRLLKEITVSLRGIDKDLRALRPTDKAAA